MNKVHKHLGQNLRQRREAQGLTQRDLAKHIGCSNSNISYVERGMQGLTVDRLIKICRVLDCTPNTLLKGSWD